MSTSRHVDIALTPAPGRPSAILRISLLPKKDPATLLDLRHDQDRDTALHPVQLLEGEEYRYEFLFPDGTDSAATIRTEPTEIFYPDTDDGRTGRLRPGLYTGTLPVIVLLGDAELGRASFEVRSTKLNYLSHYRWMLRDIAERFAEAIMERFAPTEQQFSLDTNRDAATLYQRFVFIKHLISGEQFEAAIHQILARPHRAWVEFEELRRPGQGLPAGSSIGRQIAFATGPRSKWPGGPVEYLPATMLVRRTEETRDTPENRFVKFALGRWRDLAAEIDHILGQEQETAPVARGRREVAAVVERLDELLSADLFQEVGPLTAFPAGSQVLHKRAGYRDLFRAYIQFEAAASLDWDGGEDVYSAGQRNVAVLYEFWVFLQVATTVAAFCTDGFVEQSLFQPRPDGLGVGLKRGQQCMMTGATIRNGRRLRLEVWFNRSFGPTSDPPSWTVQMRPDCSVRITPDVNGGYATEEVWLHFDAKYRVDHLRELFGAKPSTADEQADTSEDAQTEDSGRAKRSDLWKMHAYRDAIRRSAGAYVVYPGDRRDDFPAYHEILPGLGAFALRPEQDGVAQGMADLRRFLDDVLTHVASQATQHERGRFWVREAYDRRYQMSAPAPAMPFLTRPPADTEVLLGYVKSEAHLSWIREHKLYNLRGDQGRHGFIPRDSRELAAEFAVLYEPRLKVVEVWRVRGWYREMSRADLLQLGYPRPNGEFYYCLPLELVPREHWPAGLSLDQIRMVRDRVRPHAPFSLPLATTWLELVR